LFFRFIIYRRTVL